MKIGHVSMVVLAAVASVLAGTVVLAVSAAGQPSTGLQVYAEAGTGYTGAEFERAVRTILADQRSWHDQQDHTSMRIILAASGTVERLCGFRDVSCALPSRKTIVIDSRGWAQATPEYLQLSTLSEYRAYVINHEVGHLLGYIDVECVEPGRQAGVMQPQTLGLNGCIPNGWPWPDGEDDR